MSPETRSGVLIVDDDGAYALALRTSLASRLSTDVDTAACAADGMAALYGRRYQVVIADVRLPDCSGVEFLRDARAEGLVTGATVCMISANDLEGFDAGASVPVLEKRDFAELVRRVTALAAEPKANA